MSTRAQSYDDIEADLYNLAELLDAGVDSLLNVNHPATPADLSRATALFIIARDMTQELGRSISTRNTATFAAEQMAKREADAPRPAMRRSGE